MNDTEQLTCPPTCRGGIRSDCPRRPNWRAREHGDNSPRNWLWICHRHLATTCADFGEQAEIDVVRVGC
ncbi:hypothetical protein [Kitasatospora cathayae]|uniref:HNH endonuclease n=1 Tax=Kitasatospora cathayae TaxID=3004092 RepID=A0ABY7QA38_9ACTN|nr:hypothetical protein [Kitasatospora sp. HUAS 3-15]WBP89497.1 hypothetical protein O1G21_29100 [Kitasatospora sp. HUAS 3-15]